MVISMDVSVDESDQLRLLVDVGVEPEAWQLKSEPGSYLPDLYCDMRYMGSK